MFKVTKGLLILVMALIAVVICFTPETRAAGDRLVVQLDEPFEVNGQLYPPGQLTLRQIDFSPVATLNEIRVDGRCLGVLLAREPADAEVAARDELVFTRSRAGHLVLESVALQGQPTRHLHPHPADRATERDLFVASTQ